MDYYGSSKEMPKVGLVEGYEAKVQHFFVVVAVLNRWTFGAES